MDMVQARIDIMNWVTGFVEKPHAGLNGWPPCPYARRARLNGEFEIREGLSCPQNDLMGAVMGQRMVIAYVYDPKTITAADFNAQVRKANEDNLLDRNIIALADHPDDREEINGVLMNQGTWAIAFIQPLDKLNHFARLIAGKGFYDGWPEDYLQELFHGREDPRT